MGEKDAWKYPVDKRVKKKLTDQPNCWTNEREICKAIVKSLMARDVAIVIGDDRRL